MNHLPLFKFIFNQNYDPQLTQDVAALLERPPASPGELYAGFLVLDARGLAVFRGGHLREVVIISVSTCPAIFSLVCKLIFSFQIYSRMATDDWRRMPSV